MKLLSWIFFSLVKIGGAKLGLPNKTLVTILKSDFPNGNFGFKGQLKFRLANPERQMQQTLTVERKGGLKGQQIVSVQFKLIKQKDMIKSS